MAMNPLGSPIPIREVGLRDGLQYLANVFAAWDAGVCRFDACLAGIGGCPHAPGASGNVATEDLAYLVASMDRPTGVDFDRLPAMRSKVAACLAGEALYGSIARADLPKTMAAP